MNQTERSELLTVYNKAMNPVGQCSRAEVHASGLLHQTVRLWVIQDGQIWFQQKSHSKLLFPGRFDLAATGHVDPGETSLQAVLREAKEEIGIELRDEDLTFAGAIPFLFMRSDGKLDNEFANLYLYEPVEIPCFRATEEVSCMAKISCHAYGLLIKTERPVMAELYCNDPANNGCFVYARERVCETSDFCCLNPLEWELVKVARNRK